MADREDEEQPKGITANIADQVEPARGYLRDTMGELRKVKWPTQLEARNLTSVVLGTLIAMALVLGLMDTLFEQLVLNVLSANYIAIAILVVIALSVIVLVTFASRNRR